ncbi:MAG TPA: translocation/assembly module TamB domain-containing protein, partial [Tangfeifania sp.]|nr:translocation/assembly module TamB domain-containing protein [Tangfeifania sp.]
YQVDVKNLDELMKVFAPGLKIETPFLLYGRLDSEQSVFELKGSIPGFNTDNLAVRNIFIGNNPQEKVYASKFRFGEIMLKNGMSLNNVTVSSKISDNTIDNLIEWGNPEEMQYSGRIKTRTVFSDIPGSKFPHAEVEGFPTHIYVSDSLWQISPFTASIDSSLITVNNFNFFNENQFISIDGTISQDKTDELAASFENIDLSNLSNYLNRELPVRGMLNGTASIRDFYNQRLLFSDLNISDFFFKEQKIGDVKLANNWDNLASVLNSEITITNNGRKSLNADGYYNPETNIMDYDATVDKLSLVILETAIRKTFSNIHGDASGKVRIHGSPQKLLLTGALEGNNAGLTIDFTQVSYVFTDSVYFRGDTIHFDQIAIRDISGNRGTFDGTIVHTNFQDMIYDLKVRSPKIVAINTTLRNNDQFFGKVIANGQLSVTGRGKQVSLTGSATTLSGTAVNISLDSESEIERYDFIQFVSSQEEEEQEFIFSEEENEGDFSLNFTIRATPEAQAQLIYNSQIGDVIKARGEGLLVFGMDNEGNITLSGNYTVEQGDYLFTLQNVINKRFTIEQGGTIDWSGDPYDATIDINAVYKLKASLYDLIGNNERNIYQSQRIPVECKILLSEELTNPEIDFAIDFPTVENRLDEELRQYFSTQEDLNKQILSLVVLGKFYTPEYLRGTFEAQNPNLIGTTASELFSNQLSNWLSQISTNVDVGLNYRPGNQITDDEIELALSTQMFNDRVTINGNIGNNNNPYSTNQSQLVGDFEVNVKLIPSGKLQFKAYNRSNNNLIYETAPYTQGVGFSFTEDYNSFNDLLNKMKSLFSRKEEE